MPSYDAFLLVSFGGPEGPDDVMPFLANVTRGRNVPPERLASVAEHYDAFGGVSPINQQCRDLLAAVRADFAASGLALPLYWGNRNWTPYLADTVRTMTADGVRRAIAFVTSAYSSYSSCRQYLDDIERACLAVGPEAPRIDKVRRFFNHPGFIEPFAAHARAALATLPWKDFGNGTAIADNRVHTRSTVVQPGGFGDSDVLVPPTTHSQVSQTAIIHAVPAEILFKPTPTYTPEARNLHIEGEVLLEVTLQASGNLRVLRVVQGLGHGLDDNAVRAAEQIHFKPATRNGQPADSTVVLHIIFQLA